MATLVNRRTCHLVLALALSAGVSGAVSIAAPLAGATLRQASKLNCSLISPAKLTSLTGLKVSKPTTVVEGTTTTCTYSAPIGEAILQYVTGYTMKQYNANLVQYKAHGETTAALKGYGNAAVSITLGSVVAGLALIKGSDGFSVSAVLPLSKLEAVSNAVLPSL